MTGTYKSPAETGFYYLQSRYYNPEVGRFISADCDISEVGGDVLGYNVYSYCMNNPVNKTDPNGCFPISLAVIGAVKLFGFFVSAIVGVVALATIARNVNSTATKAVVNAVENKIEDAKEALDNIKAEVEEYVSTLTPKKDYNGETEEHHIVAQKAKKAELSRIILEWSNIKVNDSENIVTVKKDYHKVLHTNLYHGLVTVSLCLGYATDGAKGVKDVLKFYKKVLEVL